MNVRPLRRVLAQGQREAEFMEREELALSCQNLPVWVAFGAGSCAKRREVFPVRWPRGYASTSQVL